LLENGTTIKYAARIFILSFTLQKPLACSNLLHEPAKSFGKMTSSGNSIAFRGKTVSIRDASFHIDVLSQAPKSVHGTNGGIATKRCYAITQDGKRCTSQVWCPPKGVNDTNGELATKRCKAIKVVCKRCRKSGALPHDH
jgi:hypothetical protein